MDKKEMKRQALLEHYKELNQTGRHYNTQFWIIPGATFTIAGFLISKAFSSDLNNDLHSKILLLLSALITFVFVLKMIHQRVYHKQNKKRIEKTRELLGIEKLVIVEETKFFVCWKSCVRVPEIIIFSMIALFLAQVIMAACWSVFFLC